MGQPRGQRRSRRRQAAPADGCGSCRAPSSASSPGRPTRKHLLFGTWHYWWQAHLLDCLVDAQVRDPQPERKQRIERQIRAHRLRNNRSWANDYYDDMAWLALALERAGRLAGVERPKALKKLADQFLNAWVPEDGGGIPWRKQDQFFNAPANGPAGIFLARYDDRLRRAQQMADWIDETLIDPETHLVFDGIKARFAGARAVHLLPGRGARAGDRAGRADRGRPTMRSACTGWSPRCDEKMAPDGVIKGAGGGDGGLFNGILARYLALVATTLPENDAAGRGGRATPPREWCSSPRSRRGTTGRPSTGCRCSGRSGTAAPNCRRRAGRTPSSSRAPSTRREIPERDLSVQLSGWMLMEAAHVTACGGNADPAA